MSESQQGPEICDVISRKRYSEGMAGLPNFRSNKSKSGSFTTIAYIFVDENKPRVAYKSGVVTVNRRGNGKGSV